MQYITKELQTAHVPGGAGYVAADLLALLEPDTAQILVSLLKMEPDSPDHNPMMIYNRSLPSADKSVDASSRSGDIKTEITFLHHRTTHVPKAAPAYFWNCRI